MYFRFGISFSKLSDFDGILPRKVISFRPLESEPKKTSRTETEEARNDLSSFPCEMPSSVEVGGGDESPEIKIIDLKVMPFGDNEMSQSKGVRGQDLTDDAEGNAGGHNGDSLVVMGQLLGKILDVWMALDCDI